MKFLGDMGISLVTVDALRKRGEDVVHLRDQQLQRMPDDRIIDKAVNEDRVVITCDLDFGDLLAASGASMPSVILIRMRNQTPQAITPRIFDVLATHREALETGAIIIIQDAGYRLRRLPIY